tara:strand:+ start:22727 stop:23509 length:783 start_codon:yes stop_codon:yes gene_type:complete
MFRLLCLGVFIRHSFKLAYRHYLSVLCIFLACLSVNVSADSEKLTFNHVVRIGYIPHPSFSVDNGVTSGALSRVMECSIKLFPRIEFVEMSSYERLMFSLDTNVVDIGLNMVRTKERDALAKYAVDIYRSRVILVTRDDGSSKSTLDELPVGRLAARLSGEIGNLLAIKGYKVDINAYTVDRLIEMFRAKHINSFAEAEISVFDDLKALDAERFDFDYRVLSEKWGGAYISFPFRQQHPGIVSVWKKAVKSCRYLAPELN